MSNTVKYVHPQEPSLEWSGKGRQPIWVANWINDGGSLNDLAVDGENDADIDLGIGAARPVVDTETAAMNTRLADLAERTNAIPVIDQMHAAAGQQQLEVCLREFGFQALTAEEFVQAGVEEFNQAMVRTCRAGVAFWAAQEALKSKSTRADLARTAGMDEIISEAGIPKQRVYECISVAKFYSRLPPEDRAKALTIGKKHALLLASLPQDVIDQAAESGNDLIGKADRMTVAELKAEIKAMQRREKNYEAELELQKDRIKRLSEAKVRTTDFLLRTEEIREECMALQLGTELNINGLQKLFDEVNAEDVGLPEWRLQMEQIWVTAHTVCARAEDMITRMQETVQVQDMPERPVSSHMLNPDEATRWLLDYPLIENRFAAAATARQEKREAARPRGPGRPKGAPNKVGEA